MHRKLSLQLCGALPLVIALATPATAQRTDGAADAHHRNECRLAAQVIRTGQPAPKREWARSHITTCLEEGPAILADQWRTTQADSAHLRYLVFNSGRLRDERLYQSLRDVVADRSRPRAVRIGAMLALARYVNPNSMLGFSDVRAPVNDPAPRIPLVSGSSTYTGQLFGTHPLQEPVAPAVLGLLDRVAGEREREDRDVWYAAAVLARRVRTDIRYGRAK